MAEEKTRAPSLRKPKSKISTHTTSASSQTNSEDSEASKKSSKRRPWVADPSVMLRRSHRSICSQMSSARWRPGVRGSGFKEAWAQGVSGFQSLGTKPQVPQPLSPQTLKVGTTRSEWPRRPQACPLFCSGMCRSGGSSLSKGSF